MLFGGTTIAYIRSKDEGSDEKPVEIHYRTPTFDERIAFHKEHVALLAERGTSDDAKSKVDHEIKFMEMCRRHGKGVIESVLHAKGVDGSTGVECLETYMPSAISDIGFDVFIRGGGAVLDLGKSEKGSDSNSTEPSAESTVVETPTEAQPASG